MAALNGVGTTICMAEPISCYTQIHLNRLLKAIETAMAFISVVFILVPSMSP